MSQNIAAIERSGRLRLPAPKGLTSFLMVGFVGLAVDLGLFTALERAGLGLLLARAVSIPVATLVTWLLNRRHTFASTGRRAHHEALRYMLVTAVAQGVNYAVMIAVADGVRQVPHVAAAFCGSVVATVFSYTGQRFFTFAPSRPTPGQPT